MEKELWGSCKDFHEVIFWSIEKKQVGNKHISFLLLTCYEVAKNLVTIVYYFFKSKYLTKTVRFYQITNLLRDNSSNQNCNNETLPFPQIPSQTSTPLHNQLDIIKFTNQYISRNTHAKDNLEKN